MDDGDDVNDKLSLELRLLKCLQMGQNGVFGKHRKADIYQIDMDHATKVLSMKEDEPEIQEALEVVTTAKLITEVVADVSETVINVAAVTTAAPVKVVVPSTRRRRGVVIRDLEEESSAKTPTKTKSKDKGKGPYITSISRT
nr:hypothetical protein [Tanacetum cinerariifolium]